MTKNSAAKKAIREIMAREGISYSEAKRLNAEQQAKAKEVRQT